ncbi:MAG: AAA family ATPase, partial [Nitrospira defluvii]|nr:AAA family ATPase [Nitrospira defluvii]
MPERKSVRGRSPQLAKLTPPTLPLVLNRKRLFRVLDKSRKRPLTWITAPPGAGKTTLVASYLKARRLPVLWYRLDESDADPSTFFHYLTLAAKSLAPRFRKPLPALTPEYALGLPTFTRRYFQDLCTRLPRRCVLVLDNYQEVPETAALHHLLYCALEELPNHVSVIVMSRQQPPSAMAKLKADRGLALISPQQIELSKAEARAIVLLHNRQKTGRSVKASVDELYRRMGGWAAGIVLTLEHARSRGVTASAQAGETPETVFQYLAGEVLERLAPEVQQLLLKTSI